MRIKSALRASILSLTLLATSASLAVVGLPISDSRKAIVVMEDSPTFSIKLPHRKNSTATWYMASCYNHHLIKPMSFEANVPSSDLEGAAAFDQFNFKLSPDAFNVPQTLHVSFTLLCSKRGEVRALAGSSAPILNDIVIDGGSSSNCQYDLSQRFTIVTHPVKRPAFVKREPQTPQ